MMISVLEGRTARTTIDVLRYFRNNCRKHISRPAEPRYSFVYDRLFRCETGDHVLLSSIKSIPSRNPAGSFVRRYDTSAAFFSLPLARRGDCSGHDAYPPSRRLRKSRLENWSARGGKVTIDGGNSDTQPTRSSAC